MPAKSWSLVRTADNTLRILVIPEGGTRRDRIVESLNLDYKTQDQIFAYCKVMLRSKDAEFTDIDLWNELHRVL
jgi:hypothetical protein